MFRSCNMYLHKISKLCKKVKFYDFPRILVYITYSKFAKDNLNTFIIISYIDVIRHVSYVL